MSAVRRWNLLLRAFSVAVGILILGVGAFRAGVVESQDIAFWPMGGLLPLDTSQGPLPFSTLALFAAAQVTVWTLILYALFRGFDAIQHPSGRS